MNTPKEEDNVVILSVDAESVAQAVTRLDVDLTVCLVRNRFTRHDTVGRNDIYKVDASHAFWQLNNLFLYEYSSCEVTELRFYFKGGYMTLDSVEKIEELVRCFALLAKPAPVKNNTNKKPKSKKNE